MRTSLPLALALAFAMPAHAQSNDGELPFAPDQTGLDWVLPFKKALAKAKEEKRLLVIKPIAFGTAKDGGW
jgi:hypothetical protein